MRTRPILTILIVLILTADGAMYSQVSSIRNKVDDAFMELEDSTLTLRFFNAVTGASIPGAEVCMENADTVLTDHDGRAFFKPPFMNGQLKIEFQCKGYVSSEFQIELMAGSLFFNRFSISPNLLEGVVRIVLDWDKEPRDLDAHLIKQGAYHISYRDMKASEDKTATLDHDATTGYGPETITIHAIDREGTYEFIVHNFSAMLVSGARGLSESKGSAKIYNSKGLMKTYQVPRDQSGKFWRVFRMDHGEFVDVNELGD